MEIGAQFFTLREQCKTLEDFTETLKRVAAIGYKTIQVSAVCPYEPEWLAEQLKATGLRCVVTHYDLNRIKNDTDQVVDDHRTFACPYIGIGAMPGGIEKPEMYDQFVADYLPAAKRIAALGGKLLYHNHHFEFMKAADGRLYIDKMLETFTPEELGFTLDTYWVQYAGGDPAWWVEKLSGRVPCLHLKDMAVVNREQRMAPVGEGNMNFERVFAAAEKAGTQYMLVEQDNCYGEEPLECLRRSYEYLKAQGFA